MALANLGLRFVLELAGVAALALAGYHAFSGTVARVAAAVVAPALLIVIWALVVAPKAVNGLTQPTKDVIGTVLLLAAAGGLEVAGRRGMAVILAILVTVNGALLLVLPAAH